MKTFTPGQDVWVTAVTRLCHAVVIGQDPLGVHLHFDDCDWDNVVDPDLVYPSRIEAWVKIAETSLDRLVRARKEITDAENAYNRALTMLQAARDSAATKGDQ